jgi:hypothetical protein
MDLMHNDVFLDFVTTSTSMLHAKRSTKLLEILAKHSGSRSHARQQNVIMHN